MKQWINYRLEERDGKKPAKVPCDRTGSRRIDPHDPANWLTESEAKATGLGVGFVLTDNDPYFLIDVDNCRDIATGEWSALAVDIFSKFPGAYSEISVSGTGLHIMAACDVNAARDLKNKWTRNVEFYCTDRFVAMSGNGSGNMNIDMTAQLTALIPKRPTLSEMGLPDDGPVPEWNGYRDDFTLIARALSGRGSVNAQFGNGATFRQLWNGDPELSRFFPAYDTTDPFDRSSADAALIMHLGFWTGRDVKRCERLWRAAPLTQGRKKLQRPDYVRRTLIDTLAMVRAVYAAPVSLPPGPDVPAAPVTLPPGPDVPAAPVTLPPATGGYMTIHEMMRHFDGCTYVESDNKIMCNDAALLDKERFNVRFGGFEFQMQADGSRPTRDAWEAFTQNRMHRFRRATGVRYLPDVPFNSLVDGDVNRFNANPGEIIEGDPSRFTDLIRRLLPHDRDRRILLSWMAAIIQNPGRKFQWAMVLQGTEGNGKSAVLNCLAYAVGWKHTHFPTSQDMGEKYNSYMEGNLLIGVEEIHMDGRRDLMDRFKPLITNARIEKRAMRADKVMTDNITNWMLLTNYRNAVTKTKNDRRYCIMFTAQQEFDDLSRDGMSGSYFPDLWNWLRGGGFGVVAGFLKSYQIDAEFNPATTCIWAPKTSATDAAIDETLGVAEQFIRDAIESELPGFRGGWISTQRARDVLEAAKKIVSPNALSEILRNLGFFPAPCFPRGRSPVVIFQENSTRSTIYCKKDQENLTIQDYLFAQGYVTQGVSSSMSRVLPMRSRG